MMPTFEVDTKKHEADSTHELSKKMLVRAEICGALWLATEIWALKNFSGDGLVELISTLGLIHAAAPLGFRKDVLDHICTIMPSIIKARNGDLGDSRHREDWTLNVHFCSEWFGDWGSTTDQNEELLNDIMSRSVTTIGDTMIDAMNAISLESIDRIAQTSNSLRL